VSVKRDDMSNATASEIRLIDRDEGEELQRAEIYGLLARLWFAPPDAELLTQFAVAVTEAPQRGAFLETPWQELVAAMRASDERAAAQEYEALFVGIGKPDVLLYGSHHLAGALNELPLVALRSELADLGLTRDVAIGETEDHLSFLFEVMRYLIAGDDVAVCNLERQRRFFRAHIQPWVADALCDAVTQHPRARLYAALAGFTRAFVQVETQAFDMLE
jgi:TorA maturation chaperone TorD